MCLDKVQSAMEIDGTYQGGYIPPDKYLTLAKTYGAVGGTTPEQPGHGGFALEAMFEGLNSNMQCWRDCQIDAGAN